MSENNVPQLSDSEKNEQLEPTNEIQLSAQQSPVMTKEEIVNNLKSFLKDAELPHRTEIDALKHLFYKLRSSEVESEKVKYAEQNEGDTEGFLVAPDPLEEELKSTLSGIKEKRIKILEEEEKLKEKNLKIKLQIIEDIKTLAESSEDFGKLYKEFKDLQQKWNEIQQVPQGKVKDLWRAYQANTEKFYDLIKINNELRDYDFKKNFELKLAICEAVEVLEQESDVVSAFHQLQNFHQQWREIGPVAREVREEIWERFKIASAEINKKYQDHFIQLKASEEDNLLQKTAICEELKVIDYSLLTSAKAWDEKTKEVIGLQDKWKTIGFVPRKVNAQIFEEFRSLCDKFFENKADHFRGQKGEMEENLEKKRLLCQKVNELKISTDWKSTTDELIAIQKEWKTIGPVPRKYSDALWKEFVSACDYFFEERNKVMSSQKQDEVAHLELKKALIERINELDQTLDPEATMTALRAFMNEWNSIGFVPFKEKDKIYKEYQAALDVHFDRIKANKTERRMQNFKSTLEDISKSDRPGNKAYRERERLMSQYNRMKNDLQTYENNMGFLSVSKGADGLLKDMNRRIEDLKAELEIVVKKIEALDEAVKSSES